MGGVKFTVHAVEQYVARCRPGMTYPVALNELRGHAHLAQRTGRDRTANGDRIWDLPELGCRFVVKFDHGHQATVVTILASGDDAADVPVRPVDEQQLRRDALYDLVRYLDRRQSRGDREAERVAHGLRILGII